jgi:hypothetical protein
MCFYRNSPCCLTQHAFTAKTLDALYVRGVLRALMHLLLLAGEGAQRSAVHISVQYL